MQKCTMMNKLYDLLKRFRPVALILGEIVRRKCLFTNAIDLAWVQSSIFWQYFLMLDHIKGIGCPLLISINIDAWGHRWYFPLIIRSADLSNYSLLL